MTDVPGYGHKTSTLLSIFNSTVQAETGAIQPLDGIEYMGMLLSREY